MIMIFHTFNKNLQDYLKHRYISFIMQAAVLFYIGNLNLAIESKKMISLKGSMLGILLIIISLIINVLYYIHRKNNE